MPSDPPVGGVVLTKITLEYEYRWGLPHAHPRGHPGSPRLTSAAPDGGERRRPMLTRQNRKGNIAPPSPEFCSPPANIKNGLLPISLARSIN
jgi:hypothetical protein